MKRISRVYGRRTERPSTFASEYIKTFPILHVKTQTTETLLKVEWKAKNVYSFLHMSIRNSTSDNIGKVDIWKLIKNILS